MPLQRVAHVNLSVDDVPVAEHFYGTVLGLERAPRPADSARQGAWFQLGGFELHISFEAGARNADSKRHVAFEVDGLLALRERLAASGVAIDDGRPATGVTRFFVRDPAGNRLEFFERIS